MTKPLSYIWTRPSRTGKPMHYFRARSAGLLVRLPDDAASAAFHAEYARCLAQLETGQPRPALAGTIAALAAAFLKSPEFERLSPNTQTYHRTHLDCLAPLANFPARMLDRAHVLSLRDKISDKPRTADQRVAVIRRLYSWGIDRMLVTSNPALAVGKLDVDPGSYEPWTSAQKSTFRASNPPQAFLTAYMIANYASPRRGDILRLTRAHYNGDTIRLTPRKTKRRGVHVGVIPCHYELRAYLDALPIDVGLLVPGPNGKAWEPSAFSNAFRAFLDGIGLTECHLHGLRHSCATALIEAGCTDEEAESITLHAAGGSLRRYTKRVRQEVLARRAIKKLEGKG